MILLTYKTIKDFLCSLATSTVVAYPRNLMLYNQQQMQTMLQEQFVLVLKQKCIDKHPERFLEEED